MLTKEPGIDPVDCSSGKDINFNLDSRILRVLAGADNQPRSDPIGSRDLCDNFMYERNHLPVYGGKLTALLYGCLRLGIPLVRVRIATQVLV